MTPREVVPVESSLETHSDPALPMKLKALLALALLAPVGLALTLGVRIEPDENNVTAGRLEGTWEPDPEVCKRLGVKDHGVRIEFTQDDSFLDAIPEEVQEAIEDFPMYESGRVIYHRPSGPQSFPYLLTNLAGNPHLIMFRERDGVALGDIESMNLMVIPGKTSSEDILFTGGDFNNEPFKAYRRELPDEEQ
jgi:hypothetical protein